MASVGFYSRHLTQEEVGQVAATTTSLIRRAGLQSHCDSDTTQGRHKLCNKMTALYQERRLG